MNLFMQCGNLPPLRLHQSLQQVDREGEANSCILSALSGIQELTVSYDWLVLLWLTGD